MTAFERRRGDLPGVLPGPATRCLALIGDPVGHSGSPAMHNAALKATGRDAVYLAFGVAADAVPAAVAGMAALGFVGANVTVPHKEMAFQLAHKQTARAREAGAANVLTFRDECIEADNTDGDGFLSSIADAGMAVAGRKVLLIGAGGAARSVAAACLAGGARQVMIANRHLPRAVKLVSDLETAGAGRVTPWVWPPAKDFAHDADMVINATPLGLRSEDPSPVADWTALPGAVAVDLVYAPHETAFLAGARAANRQTVDGRRMLVHQAALSWVPWFGAAGPVDIMARALTSWLAAR